MPVLATIAAVTYLFSRRSGDSPGFLSPTALRKKIEKLPEGSAREESLAIVDELDGLAQEYDVAADAAIRAYIEDIEDWNSSYADLIEKLVPTDQMRRRTLSEIVRLRQRLAETLSVKQWDKVFG